ncbi:MAG: DinB family protein [Bacteroidota bacterium]
MSTFTSLFLKEIRRRLFDEGIRRASRCLNELDDQQIWQRPNDNSNSVGNLILHLNGNVRQWVLSGLAKQVDIRQRQSEFDERGPIPKETLIDILQQLERDIAPVLDRLTEEDLVSMHIAQGFEESGIGILIHVVEHFSYHVGQMVWAVKAWKDMDMGFYAGVDLG